MWVRKDWLSMGVNKGASATKIPYIWGNSSSPKEVRPLLLP